MKRLNKILSFVLVFAIMVTVIPVTVSADTATGSGTVNLFSGSKAASTWTQVLTYDTVKNNGTFNPAIIKENGYFQATFTGNKEGLQMIFQSWSGGSGWAIVVPSEITTSLDGSYLAKFTYSDITASYGTNFSVLDRLYFNTTTGAITLTSLDYVSEAPAPTETVEPTIIPTPVPSATVEPTITPTPVPSATVEPTVTPTPVPSATVETTITPTPVPSATVEPTVTPTQSAPADENRINLFNGSEDVPTWTQGLRIPTLKNGGVLDTSVVNEDGYFAVTYTESRDSLKLIFQSWSGGGGWITVSPTIIKKNSYKNYTAIFDYDTVAADYGTKFTALDAIYVLTTNGAITLKSVDYVTSGVQNAIADASPTPVPSVEPTYVPGELAERTFLPDDTHVKAIGRTYVDADGTRWITNTASGIEFTFTGTKASVTVKTSYTEDTTNQARIGIFVNGALVMDDMIDEMEKTYTFFQNATSKAVSVRIIKLSESPFIPLAISNISVTSTADIQPEQEKTHKIEFIGDSITCGYGVDDENIYGGFKTATENGSKTYAYKTAAALNADYSIIAASGFGIISGYTSGAINSTQTIPPYYNDLGFSWYSFADGSNPTNMEWDFNQFQPDAVVINLGTNDNSYCGTNALRKAEFVEGYIAFLKQIRAKNPDAMIFCTLGIMGQELYPQIQEAVLQYTAETNDTRVTCMQFDVQAMSDGICVDWHPSEKTHTKAADLLTDYIGYVMGW
ncbi:GDSL-type esterase/lipase family protein [Anaeromicropila populeti]|uniref:GDSL-like Lipase/Acylhydrolase family protein n=1 Tax=Anaeromicropila populeti TaxID=37658 RepID=A0A1I6L032_9FIRM|nr:GDSL-type esterase/lipase family protein [Anaeromicropila populeti]SFR96815.1 GDSL-like Lipase/Acylhydrolase family protein [Anaeromicropila populeti]